MLLHTTSTVIRKVSGNSLATKDDETHKSSRRCSLFIALRVRIRSWKTLSNTELDLRWHNEETFGGWWKLIWNIIAVRTVKYKRLARDQNSRKSWSRIYPKHKTGNCDNFRYWTTLTHVLNDWLILYSSEIVFEYEPFYQE